jgi:uncharacterized membrane protein
LFEDFLGLLVLLGGIGLIVSAVRQQGRISMLEREIGALRSLVLSLSMAGVKTPAPATPDVSPVVAPASSEVAEEAAAEAPVSTFSDEAPVAAPVEPPQPQSVPDQPAPQPAPARRPDIETALGTRWAVWVGGVALALGGLFLVRYTIEAGYFGPAARVTLAAIFGLALAAVGEFLRRTGYRLPVEGAAGAYIPAILTAAGAFTLFGAIYAAHGVYGFIGPTLAFLLLGLIGLGTLTLALLHGQALAGAGLLGAMATPLLVSSQAPNIWVLFGYIAIVLAFSTAVARLRGWIFLVSGAFAASGLWTLLYMAEAGAADVPTSPTVVLFIGLVSLAALGFIWFGRLLPDLGSSRIETAGPLPGAIPAAFLGLSTLILLADIKFEAVNGPVYGTVLALAMLGVALWRRGALPLVYGAGIAAMVAYLRVALAGDFSVEMMGETVDVEGLSGVAIGGPMRLVGALLGIAFLAAGVWRARALQASNTFSAASWASFAGAVPLVIAIAVWLGYGNLDRDLVMAAVAVVLAVALAAGGEWTARALPMAGGRGLPVTILLSAAFAAWILALHMAFGSWLTTILVGASAALPAFATRTRTYPVLGALAVAAAVITLVRVAIDPTLVGLEPLSTTPVFNALLPGYGIPSLAFAFAAWQLARTTGGRPRLAMEAAAALFGLLAVAMLVRHAMNGGVIYGAAPSLGEQAIYTLVALGAGAILIALDMRSPSSVFRYGSIGIGVASTAAIALQHFLLLNPLFTEEPTGQIPVFNLLFLAYLLPAIGAGALALYARSRRPAWYAMMLAATAALLAFAYATLSVRRLFHGEFIGLSRGLGQLETYSYSALWLALGVALLVIGVRTTSTVLRLASGALIAIAVAKVFLFDMSELEGVLRALSFIGLGAVLIGIGLFYQRLLSDTARRKGASG